MINNVVFRLDCGKIIGSGHLMRCLALARSLKKINYQCFFVAYDFTKEIIEKEINNEFQIFYLNSIKYKKNPDEFEKLIASFTQGFSQCLAQALARSGLKQ